VKNEKSQRFENVPYRMAFIEEIGKALYPDRHPYSWPIIGYVDDLNRATVNDVKNFFLRWYGPNNAILTLSGDFNSADALKLIDKYFGGIKPCPEVKKMRAATFTIPTDKYVAYKDRTYFPLNLRVYPTVPQYHRDEAALDVLGIMMGSGNNSIFYKNFVKSDLASTAFAYHQGRELAGEFTIGIFAYPPADFNLEKLFGDIDTKVKATIDEFEKTGITDDALARAKAEIESRQYGSLSSVADKASVISEWERLLGKTSSITEESERYSRITKEDVTRVFLKYIKGSGAAILNTYPIMNQKDSVKSFNPHANDKFPPNPEYNGLTYSPNPDKFNRAERPVPGPAKQAKVPEYYNSKLKNGLAVIGTHYTESPEITLVLNIEGGSLVLPADQLKKIGIAELTAQILNEGTKDRTTEQIAAELEKLGSSINFYAGKTSTTVRVECLKKSLDGTLKVLEEKLLSPGFRADDFKLAKTQYKESIKNQATDPEATAGKAISFALYGSSALGLEPSLKSWIILNWPILKIITKKIILLRWPIL